MLTNLNNNKRTDSPNPLNLSIVTGIGNQEKPTTPNANKRDDISILDSSTILEPKLRQTI